MLTDEQFDRAKRLALEWRARFFTEVIPQRWSPTPAVRRLVRLRPLNLARMEPLAEAPFDVIFSRNVLMHLEASRREIIVNRLASMLALDGLLILDPCEHLGRAGHPFAPGVQGVYLRRAAPAQRHEATQTACLPGRGG